MLRLMLFGCLLVASYYRVWSAVDLLFSLPDVPMTFMDEINGEAYRVQITNVYESKDFPKPNKLPSNFKSKSFNSSLL